MSKNVDLTSKEWCDLVFEGKNKAFGGYLLRVNSPKRYTWATIGVICVVAFAFVLPYIVESFKFGEVEEETTVVVEMTQLPEAEVEKQEVQPLVETPPPPPLKSSIKLFCVSSFRRRERLIMLRFCVVWILLVIRRLFG